MDFFVTLLVMFGIGFLVHCAHHITHHRFSMNFKIILSDIDECAADTDNCSANAVCIDLVGSFGCECNTGFSGDGVNCTGESQY